MFETLISPLAIILSLSATTGVLLHDTKVDKMTALALATPIAASRHVSEDSSVRLESTPHTHVERASLEHASRELRNRTPRVNPRGNEDKKYRLQKKVGRGQHSFDSYNMPLA